MREHRHDDTAARDGEALHAYPITQELGCRLNRRAFPVMHRQHVDERAAPAWIDEDHCRRIGDQVAVEVAESDQVAYQSGVHLLRRALAVLDGAPPPVESNRGFRAAGSGKW